MTQRKHTHTHTFVRSMLRPHFDGPEFILRCVLVFIFYFSFFAFSIRNMNHMNNKCRNQIKNTLTYAAAHMRNLNYNVNYCFVHKVTCFILFLACNVSISLHTAHYYLKPGQRRMIRINFRLIKVFDVFLDIIAIIFNRKRGKSATPKNNQLTPASSSPSASHSPRFCIQCIFDFERITRKYGRKSGATTMHRQHASDWINLAVFMHCTSPPLTTPEPNPQSRTLNNTMLT